MDVFSPVPGFLLPGGTNTDRLGDSIRYFGNVGGFPEITEPVDIIILGLGDFSNINEINNSVPDEIRKHLYLLFKGHYTTSILDAGNIQFQGLEEHDTNEDRIVAALQWAAENSKLVLLLGDSQAYTYYIHEFYRRTNRYFNLGILDATLDMDDEEGAELSNKNWLSKILLNRLNKVFNVSLLGYQNYLVSSKLIQGFIDLNFDVLRIGDMRVEIEDAEPYLRDADVVSVDASAMQFSACPAAIETWPNGMRGEEICKLARYMGMSMKLQVAGFFNLDKNSPFLSIGASAMAQVIWHVIDGYYSRTVDNPDFSSSDYINYEVAAMDGDGHSLLFYQNRISNRWWLRIPLPIELQIQYNVPEFIIPCSEKDYIAATQSEVPERWLNSLKKLNI